MTRFCNCLTKIPHDHTFLFLLARLNRKTNDRNVVIILIQIRSNMVGLLSFPFMEIALEEAAAAAQRGEVPVGAVLVDYQNQQILAKAGNRVEELRDPTAHAEMLVIREVNRKILAHADLYVTLEPCPMCATAISFARIRRLYFGAEDPKGGGVEHGCRVFTQPTCHHRPEVYGGISGDRSTQLLRQFFQARR